MHVCWYRNLAVVVCLIIFERPCSRRDVIPRTRKLRVFQKNLWELHAPRNCAPQLVYSVVNIVRVDGYVNRVYITA